MIQPISPLNFLAKPQNYAKIDNNLSRSAQPQKEDLSWLKEQGITDIFNFRTMHEPNIAFNEKKEAEKLGIRYHHIPSVTYYPDESNVKKFMSEVDNVIKNGGKAHIHCKAGSDRTGMYAYIYKTLKGIGDKFSNQQEMIKMGHNIELYPDLIFQTNQIINKLITKK